MPSPPPAALPISAPSDGGDWLRSVEAIQRAAAQAHETFQRTLTESHTAFLAFAEQSMAVLGGGAPVATARASAAPVPVMAAVAVGTVAAVPAAAPPTAAPAAAEPAPAPAVADVAAPPADLATVLLAIVAEHTGYPQDMLQLHMDLEADLGIDSIKRVEILAALEERWPGLSLGTERIAAVRTLADVVGTVQGGLAAPAASVTPPSPPAPPVAAASVAAASVAAPSVAAAAAGGARLQRVALRVAARPVSEAVGLPALRAARRVVVTGGGAGLAERVAARLTERGRPAEVSDALPADVDGVIALHGLGPVASVEDALALDRALLAAARGFARAIGDRPGVFVAVQDAGGDFGLGGAAGLRAWCGGAGALVKTLAQELPAVGVKALDVALAPADPDAAAERIVDELWSGGPELEVGIGPSGERVVPIEAPADLADGGLGGLGAGLAPGAVVVASGGARGVTAAALLALARRAPLRFALLGRSPLSGDDASLAAAADAGALRGLILAQARAAGEPPSPRALDARVHEVLAGREARATLSALSALGAEARYLQADVRDAAAVGAALAAVRRDWGPVAAVVHGAGTLADALLRDKTDDAIARVLDTKLLGLHALLEATREDPVSHLVLFSSIAARAGNPGQADYALANAVLAQVAAAEARRRGPACRVRALLWGPLAGGMVTEAVAARMRARGVPLLDVAAGAEAFAREMVAPGDDVAVVLAASAMSAGQSPADRTGGLPGTSCPLPPDPQGSYLGSHVINGRPVLPLALVLEWFCRHLRGERGEGRSLLCRDLRVLRGVPLENGIGERLHVRAEEAGAERRLVLLDGDGHGRFQARLAWGGTGLPAGDGFLPAGRHGGVTGVPWGRERIYGPNALSYGPAFQVLEEVQGLADDSAAARVRGTAAMDWPDGPWTTDGAAVEGCLQLAVLWAAEAHGMAALPMHIEEYEQYAAAAAPGPLRCALRRREVGHLTARADVRLFGADGTPLADLRGIELVARPS